VFAHLSRAFLHRLLQVTLVFLLTGGSLLLATGRSVSANVDQWQKGFAWWDGTPNYGSAQALESLQRLRATGANSVAPVITWYVDSVHSSIAQAGPETPSDADLTTFVGRAHELGMKVMFTLHVNSRDGAWRGTLAPDDKDAWFGSYREMADHYADLGARLNVEGLCIGAELLTLTGAENSSRWQQLITDLRNRFHGFLTYSAQWGSGVADVRSDPLEEFTKIGFWSQLDYLGISAYFNLSPNPTASVQELLSGWNRWYTTRLAPFQAQYRKPLLLTEVGYKSTPGAPDKPYDETLDNGVDLQVQANLYEALLRFWDPVPWLAGVYFWHWTNDPNAGGAQDTDYTPQNKPAQDMATAWFGRSASNSGEDWPIPGGWFFTQARGDAPEGQGFAVTNEGGVPFWSYFQRAGGVSAIGYPISQRFVWDGFVTQAFQKVVFQWNPASQQVQYVNVFDQLSAAGKDDWLLVVRSVPRSLDWVADQGQSWDQVVSNHLALLDQNQTIRRQYLSGADPVLLNGLPMSLQDFGTVIVLRAQRQVLQQWKVDVPWARAGQVVVANGGDVAKEAGLLPPTATVPTPSHS